jgi:hypothetical protein
MLCLIAFVILVVVSNAMSRGWLRTLVYAGVFVLVWSIIAWIAVGRPATGSVAVSIESVAWVDQRLRKGSMKREAISRIEQVRHRTPFGQSTGSWLVDTGGHARVKLMARIPARELASALEVPLVEARELVTDQREVERRLPGSGEIRVRHAIVQYVIPFGLGLAALALNSVT